MISPRALSEARIYAGLSQRELARRVGLGYQTIRRIELGAFSGNLTLKNLGDIAEKLRVAPVSLLEMHTPAPREVVYDTDELTVAEARLLRGLQTGRRSTRSLSRAERELHLPRLHRAGLLAAAEGLDIAAPRLVPPPFMPEPSHP